MRIAATGVNGVLVSDTSPKFIKRWLPGPPSPESGRHVGLVLGQFDLPKVPTLDPREIPALRQRVLSDLFAFNDALGNFIAELRRIKEDDDCQHVVVKVRVLSTQLVSQIRGPVCRIEREIQTRIPGRSPIKSIGKLVLGPLASSPVLTPTQGTELADVYHAEVIDVFWFRHLLRANSVSMLIEF